MSEKNRFRHLSICSVKWAVNGPFVCALCSRFLFTEIDANPTAAWRTRRELASGTLLGFRNALWKFYKSSLYQGLTNFGRQVSFATKFCTVAPSTCGFSIWNMLHVINQAFRFLEISCITSFYTLYCSWGNNCVSVIQTKWLSHVLTDLNWKGHSCPDSRNLYGSLFLHFYMDWCFQLDNWVPVWW